MRPQGRLGEISRPLLGQDESYLVFSVVAMRNTS
jgi:hypothetical protein